MTHSHFTPNHFICPSNIQPKSRTQRTQHTHTHMHTRMHAHAHTCTHTCMQHKLDWTRLVETREEKCCWGRECTYFLCFMTIVINVQAIRHCHWRTYTAALKDLAISINVLCPSVAMSSFPLNNLIALLILCQLYLQLNCQSTQPCGGWRQWNLQAPSSCIVLLWVNRACVCLVPIVFSVGYIQDCLFSKARKNKFETRLSHPRGSFTLSWIMATITEDIGL